MALFGFTLLSTSFTFVGFVFQRVKEGAACNLSAMRLRPGVGFAWPVSVRATLAKNLFRVSATTCGSLMIISLSLRTIRPSFVLLHEFVSAQKTSLITASFFAEAKVVPLFSSC